MKICFFNRSYWPDQAATGQLLTELAEDLVARHGCEVTVVAGQAINPDKVRLKPDTTETTTTFGLIERETHNGVRIIRAKGTTLRPQQFIGRAANYVSYAASAALASFDIGRPDVVVSLTDPPIIGRVALWAARRTGARFVFLCEDIFPEVAALVEDFRSTTVNRALDRINRRLLREADAVVALGDRMRRRLIEEKGAPIERIQVIHNWADCDAIRPGAKDNAFSRAHGLADRFVVMHSGNVGLSQNLDVLIEAADRLRSKERLVFAVVGGGARKERLERAAADRGLTNVRFFPYQPKDDLHDSFATADAFLVSLKAGLEGYIVPSKLYGILAAGRPYIAAVDPSCEVAQLAAAHGCGVLAAPGDPRALADAIATLYKDPAAARLMGQRARALALQFDRRVAVAAYHDLFRRVADLRPGRLMLKRLIDVTLSAFGLAVSSPLWVIIPAAIKLEDRGPVFFRQERVGLGGRVFKALKFRSMIPDAEALSGPVQAAENDPRVTRVGRLLRATAMDELPQLVNILVGDMSFVGPRPLRPGEIDISDEGQLVRLEDIPGYEIRHRVRPGLTGLAQVYAARDLRRAGKFRLDRLYIERGDLWLDLKLLAISFWITGRGDWERRERSLLAKHKRDSL